MATDQILAMLIAERERINRAIEALQGPAKRRGRPLANQSPDAPSKRGRTFTREQRQAAADRMKAMWAKKKKAAKK